MIQLLITSRSCSPRHLPATFQLRHQRNLPGNSSGALDGVPRPGHSWRHGTRRLGLSRSPTLVTPFGYRELVSVTSSAAEADDPGGSSARAAVAADSSVTGA